MPGEPLLVSGAAVTAETCRRFLYDRGDVSLGLVPQLLLDERAADLWSYFWCAARHADDDIEARRVTADAYADLLDAVVPSTLASIALQRFFEGLPPDWDPGELRTELRRGLAALGRERAFVGPPSVSDYASVVHDKAGVPLRILHRLLLPGEESASLHRFSLLLATSIQLGDDVRDWSRDAEQGLHTITADEFDVARRERPDDADAARLLIGAWRERAAQWLALLALERAERLVVPANRSVARIETLLWLGVIEHGQLRDVRHPMRWPAPLGDLLQSGMPSAARMAAARRVIRQETSLLGAAHKWGPSDRAQAVQDLKKNLPPLYGAFEEVARS